MGEGWGALFEIGGPPVPKTPKHTHPFPKPNSLPPKTFLWLIGVKGGANGWSLAGVSRQKVKEKKKRPGK